MLKYTNHLYAQKSRECICKPLNYAC